MKKITVLLCLVVFVLTTRAQDNETRAVWLTTVKSLDWPKTKADSPAGAERQKRELTDMLDRLKAININTILLQTRIRGTVIYPSRLEPWDVCLTGREGVSPGYDPLRFAIEECHKRGMKIQAWVVTLPLGKWNSIGCRQIRQKNPKIVKRIGDEGFLHPEMDKSADIIADICAEIASNYNVDGIHLDYMRYPDGWKVRKPRTKAREDITRIVRKIHNRVKAVKPQVKLSCSPIGKYSDLTRYSSRGWNARDAVCQEAQEWLREGIMDQLFPMIYFKENNFYPFAADWAEQCPEGRQVVAGLGTWMLDPREGNWKIDEVIRQLNVCRQLGLGQCHFRAKFVLENHQGIYDFLRTFNFPDCWEPIADNRRHLFEGISKPTDQQGKTTAHSREVVPPVRRVRLLEHDGQTLRLKNADGSNKNRFIIVKTLAGTTIAMLTINHDQASVKTLPDGFYQVYTADNRDNIHRLGFIKIGH